LVGGGGDLKHSASSRKRLSHVKKRNKVAGNLTIVSLAYRGEGVISLGTQGGHGSEDSCTRTRSKVGKGNRCIKNEQNKQVDIQSRHESGGRKTNIIAGGDGRNGTTRIKTDEGSKSGGLEKAGRGTIGMRKLTFKGQISPWAV